MWQEIGLLPTSEFSAYSLATGDRNAQTSWLHTAKDPREGL